MLRIASYNIRKARGLDQKRRPERTVQVINGLDADVVVLQEADKRLGPRHPAIPRAMIDAETDFELVDVCANDISIGWHGNAVLVRKGLSVRDTARLELPGLEPRGAVRLTLNVGVGVTVVATHLGLLRRDRRAQLAVLAQATAGEGHVIMAGDFNEWSADKGFEPLAERFETYSPGRSFHARRPMAALDRFALTQGIALRDAGVEQGPLARVASDHLPIWSDVIVPSATY
ncbi:endonuclease/exonuclease/phosphatase family protein [uncultured Sulfitobacter sp.]|uniref:endonuclease/exonuclease/phosphatase family protein n=1 Tax=uncultured Sulfitobacter sp. TaxID=191468 RepID=UPI00261D0914|nr:endonuclease/exonuclease/phosphatase family protein [uncultured Sulfitobacter sp.]